MPVYVKTTLWNEQDEKLFVGQTIHDTLTAQVGDRKMFFVDGKDVMGAFDWVMIRGDNVFVDYILVGEQNGT